MVGLEHKEAVLIAGVHIFHFAGLAIDMIYIGARRVIALRQGYFDRNGRAGLGLFAVNLSRHIIYFALLLTFYRADYLERLAVKNLFDLEFKLAVI